MLLKFTARSESDWNFSDGIIGGLHSPDTAHVSDIVSVLMVTRSVAAADSARVRQGELVKDITKLQEEVNDTKLQQEKQINEIKEEVINEMKKDITTSLE